ncbi:MAG: reverse transcriptase-like protein [Lachnospiraceae bacterium]|nr:reverse transcriptase-like protein [Lachnospiraceae bacterium]
MGNASEQENLLTAYVDGSYNDEIKRYAFGCVFLPPQGGIYLAMGNGENPETVSMRNVTGEMLGAMYAVKTAMKNGFSVIALYYDYEGIEKWVTGAWKAKKEHTKKYAQAMQEWGKQIEIRFYKVTAHSKVEYNELADKTAKRGLEEGKGIPPIRMLEEMETWSE